MRHLLTQTPLIKLSFAASLLATVAACTQPAAQIDLKGGDTYGRNGVINGAAPISYSNNAPSSYTTTTGTTAQTAAVAPIGVTDLSAPVSHSNASITSQAVPAVTPFQRANPGTLQPAAGGNINQWTKQPRDQSLNISPQGQMIDTHRVQTVAQVATHDDTAVSQLDNVIGNSKDAEREVAQEVAQEAAQNTQAPVAHESQVAPQSVKAIAKMAAPAEAEEKKPSAAPATAAITKPVKSEIASNASGFMWPVNSKKIISEYGPKGGGKANDGINIASADGEPVWAAADGEVVYVGNELAGYGNMVLIKHQGGKATTYAHMSKATVEKYDHVKQGDIIGYVGSTGNVKEPQLHFAIRDGSSAVDPMKYLSRKVVASAE